jgi:uncharacterized protein (DUF58 family)
MIALPSTRLLRWTTFATVAAFGVIVFPRAWLPLVAFDVVLAAAVLIDWLLTPRAKTLDARRLTPERISVLHPVEITIVVRNQARMPLRVRVRDTAPVAFGRDADELAGEVPALGEVRWQYRATPATRGCFQWGPIHLRYRSLLGFWEGQKSFAAHAESRVYPSMVLLERYHLLARSNRLDVLGVRKVRLRGSAWEFESLRDYTSGDDVRLIDWKATARRRKLIVRNQEAERNQTIILLVDSGRLMNAESAGVAKLDHAVNAALMLAHVALTRGDRVGLCTFSHRVHTWVEPRAQRVQVRLLSDALYDLRGDFSETDHGRCLRLVAGRFPKRALLIVLTDFVDADTAADMIAHLRLAARRHVVLFAALKDSVLEQVAREHIATVTDGFRKAAAVDLLRERREVLERLHRLGIHVLDADPSAVTPALINGYLEIAFRGLL